MIDFEVIKSVSSLGVTGVLVLGCWFLYQELNKTQGKLDTRYEDLQELNKEVKELVRESVKVNTELIDAIKNQSNILRDIDRVR